MSSTYFPLFFPDASAATEVVVTPQQFCAFHRIDRILYSRLVFVLNRDRNQSYEVFSFLFMLEQSGYARNIIAYLVSLPDEFVDLVANEVVVCLSFLRNQAFSTNFFAANANYDHNSIIPLIVEMTRGKITLRVIHQNREVFLEGLVNNINEICRSAFNDIWVRADMYNKKRWVALEREKAIEEMQNLSLTKSAQQGSTSRLSVRQETTSRPSVQQVTTYRPNVRQETMVPQPPPPPHVEEEAENTTVEEETEEKEKVDMLPADDRTVFLTFSKGYPITEEEVRVYFTRKFGEVIETILMPDAEVHGQALFAKMVLKMCYASKMENIVTASNKNKFTINGKHVWARKYVPKI
ncbi:hypothetical protein V5N11_015981 [Cardamine amara subsp. amara]|uniref:Rho guanine nucleotide exchange factor n=1 Tax=Cardamine amara subsp. amara TaxID=228776 RepID=A0ABD1B0I0_CARAN